MNFYTYVNGDPINFIDPSGLKPEDLIAALSYLKTVRPDLIFDGIQFFDKYHDGDNAQTINKSIVHINMALLDHDTQAGPERIAKYIETVAHELMHVQDLRNNLPVVGYLYTILPWRHNQIYSEAYKIRKGYEEGNICPKR
jgi:hypothetical protein